MAGDSGVGKYVLPVEDDVWSLAFCSSLEASNLLAVGGSSDISIKDFNFDTEDDEGESWLDVLKVKDVLSILHHNASCICWSPATSHQHVQYRFCASSRDDGTVTAFSSTLDQTTCKVLSGHKSFVNDLCAHPNNEVLVASVGDDCVCRVWDLQQAQLRSEYKLGAPGRSVRWHPLDPDKLIVAERGGLVRLYDTSTDCPILSVDCPTLPLLDVDWAPSNSQLLGGVADRSWFLWDLSYSSQPLESKAVPGAVLVKFRWCCQSDQVFATLSASSHLQVHHLAHHKVPLSCELQSANDLAWHAEVPLVAAACNKQVNCWQVEL